jgi:lysophospholipase L1-like esterase
MRTILCYGDSNTWGCPPIQPGHAVERYGPDVRWGGVLRSALGPGYWVVEEGLGGRTTVWDDPIEGAHKNGKRYLLPCLESHAPLDLVALMLGTNDLKQRFGLAAADIATGVGALIDIVVRSGRGPQNRAPQVLLICPPPTAQLSGFAELFAGAGEKSRGLAAHYRREADLRGCAFLHAGQIISVSPQDGIHFEAAAQRLLGRAVARSVQHLLGA